MRALLRLIRFPNTLTAAADVAAGAAIGGLGVLSVPTIVTALGSMALYGAGVAMNDVTDIEKDRREHPNRPLPSGRFSTTFAWAVIAILSFAAVASGPLAAHFAPTQVSSTRTILLLGAAATTMGFAALYNLTHESKAGLARLLMGATRASNVLRGVLIASVCVPSTSAAQWSSAIAIAGHGLLIYGITAVSQHEESPDPTLLRRWPRFLMAVAIVPGVLAFMNGNGIVAMLCLIAGVEWAHWGSRPAATTPPHPGRAVGRLIGSLALYDALLVASTANTTQSKWMDAVLVASLFPIGTLIRRLTASEAA